MASSLTIAGSSTGVNVQLVGALQTVFSKEILFYAQPNLRFDQFAVKRTELGTQPGMSIQFLKYSNLTKGGTLTEGTDMQTKALSSSLVTISVAEKGNAIAVSELLLQTSFDDVMASSARLLGMDMAKVLDSDERDVVLATSNVKYAPAGVTATTLRTKINSACTMSVAVIKDSIETLATNNATKINGDFYVCFLHPHQSRGLRDDSAWINASNYGAPGQLFTGEIGRIDDTIFVETTMMPYIDTSGNVYENGGDSGADEGTFSTYTSVYEAVIFGDNAYGHAIALPVEMRDDGVQDFGRKHGLAWYAIWGTGIITGDNIVRIETA